MVVKIETMLCMWDKDIPHIFMKLVNMLTLASNEQGVRKVMKAMCGKKEYKALFMHGFGQHHLWVCQRKVSDPTQCMENRLLIVEF